MRKWLTPDQTWIHGEGLLPDVVVEVPDDSPAGSDPVLERAIELLRERIGAPAQGLLPSLAAAA
ncbi:hypothetical protein BH24CHL9_BH24CHL9_12180 [soil metagenome]